MSREVRTHPAASWRALMYVPAHVEQFVAKAPDAGADAIILDLEDSVPVAQKAAARAALPSAIASIKACGVDVLVRINRPLDLAVEDVQAAVAGNADAIVVAKVDGQSHVRLLDEYLERCEVACGRDRPTYMMLLVETLNSFWQMRETAAASPRVVAMALGGEDIAAAVQAESDEETLLWPRQQMIFAAASVGVAPIGLLGSITEFSDHERFRLIAERSRRFGFWGATCVHPTQVRLISEAFTPSPDELERARRIVEAMAQAETRGEGAVTVDGRMVDPPVAARAQRIMELHRISCLRRKPTKEGI